MAFNHTNYLYTIGNSVTVSTAANTVYSPYTVFTSDGTVQSYRPAYAENAVIPDSPEQWLRRRVKEVCEMANAA